MDINTLKKEAPSKQNQKTKEEERPLKRPLFVRQILKVFFFIVGTLSLAIGGIGVLLPVIPGTPFIVFGVVCYIKSCRPLANLMLKNRQVREYVENYHEKTGITLSTKIISIFFSLSSFAVSMYFAKNAWLRSALIIIYGLIVLKILFTKTRPKTP